MISYHPYSIFPLGDSALNIDFGNNIDLDLNHKVISLYHLIKESNIPCIQDIVPSYSSLAVHYNISFFPFLNEDKTVFEWLAEKIELLTANNEQRQFNTGRHIKVPVCYAPAYSPDLHQLANHKKISPDKIIELHTAKSYRVYMIGFLPGFPYMGQVDDRISMQRKAQPEKVQPGDVGIAGMQTGIYPLSCPGGWHIIGRTPLKLFDKSREYPVLFQQGDDVTFYPITEDEFEHYKDGNS
jgi:inhibitor of KinA